MTFLGQFLESGVALGMEKGLHDLLAFSGISQEETAEIALRQKDDLAELVGLEAEELFYSRRHVLGGQELFIFSVLIRFIKGRFGRSLLQARAAFLGDFLFRTAVDAVVFLTDGEAEGNGRHFLRRGVLTAHVRACTAVAAGAAVEGITDSIEDSRLARACRPIDEKELVLA